MSFSRFKAKPLQKFTASMWNELIDELNKMEMVAQDALLHSELSALAYSIVPDQDSQRDLGSESSRWRRVFSAQGFFSEEVFVQGRRVLKDGDPITISDISIKKSELYDADATAEQSIVLDVGGYKTVGVIAQCSAPTTFTVEISFDGEHWFTHYSSVSPESQVADIFLTVARYVRLKSSPVSVPGAKVTLVIGAKP